GKSDPIAERKSDIGGTDALDVRDDARLQCGVYLYRSHRLRAAAGFPVQNWQSSPDQKEASVTLSRATASAKLFSEGSDTRSTFLSSTICTVSGSNTIFRVVSGTDGQNHKVTVNATFSDGDVLQADLIVEVRDL